MSDDREIAFYASAVVEDDGDAIGVSADRTRASAEVGGVLGLMAVIMVYALIVARSLRMALASHDAFGKLLACGLGFTFALQVFAIIGGVTRLLPLTGLTTPFMSQGGSSMISNWVIIAVLLVISHQARRPPMVAAAPVEARFEDEDTLQIPAVRGQA